VKRASEENVYNDACLFCRIVAGEEPAVWVAQAELVVAFRDKFPRAPVHVLVVTRDHVPSVHELSPEHDPLLGEAFALAREIADSEGIAEGYRIATNVGQRGGQAIPHLHFHVLGGRQLLHIDSGDPPA
jgi:histidine triad (HIT) family protein